MKKQLLNNEVKEAKGSRGGFVVGEVPVRVRSPEGGAPEANGVPKPQGECTNTGTSLPEQTFFLFPHFLSHFLFKTKKNSMGTNKIGEAPPNTQKKLFESRSIACMVRILFVAHKVALL